MTKALSYDAVVMRELGENLPDRGFFEINLTSGGIGWMNEFTLNKLGMTLDQVRVMSVYDFIPSEYQAYLGEFIEGESRGRTVKFSIWPWKAADGLFVWWYITKQKSSHPNHWYKAEYLNTTESFGKEFAAMLAAMMTANSYNSLHTQFIEHQLNVKKDVDRLSEESQELRESFNGLTEQVKTSKQAAQQAANEALRANEAITKLSNSMEDQFTKQAAEIIRLINTDTQHDARMAAFNAEMKKAAQEAAQEAVRIISESANKAGKQITVHANRAGQGLARKVTIPVGAIAAIATIIQWILNNLHH